MTDETGVDKVLTHRIERLLGTQVRAYRPVVGGYTPAIRLLCETPAATFFVKVGATPLTSQFVRREIHVYTSISGDFMPDLVAYEDHEDAPILVIEDLSAHHWPPPWSEARIEVAMAQMAVMHATEVDLEPFHVVHAGHGSGWHRVAADPEPLLSLGFVTMAWLERALPILLQSEARCRTEGSSLAHCDLRSDNICLAGERAIFVDWNLACLCNPTLDLAFWLPSLAYEGGPQPDRILPDAPEAAAWVSGYFAARAGLPQIPDAPRVRWVQRRQLETALPWAIRALDLPPMGGP